MQADLSFPMSYRPGRQRGNPLNAEIQEHPDWTGGALIEKLRGL
jgi:hypothetical protein